MNIEKRANEILEIQRNAILNLKISSEMIIAINKIIETTKNEKLIITSGIGKAGIIASKMSATLSSIGIRSIYIHPAESLHGDLGRVSPNDLIIIFSHSGSTMECINMVNAINKLNNYNNYIITISSSKSPKIESNLVISYGNIEESCIVKKVPSTSTTIMLIIADILALTAAESIGLNDDWFRLRHPGGAIGSFYQQNK